MQASVGGESSPLMSRRTQQATPQSSRIVLFRRLACSPDTIIFVGLCLSYAACAAFSIWTFVLLAQTPSERVFLAAATRVAAMLTFASVPLSIADILQHLFHYSSRTQRLYVRILMLPPIYAIESYVALAVPSVHFALETLRETYECIALLAVYDLARETLGADIDIVQILQEGPTIYAERVRIEGITGAGNGDESPTSTAPAMGKTEAFIFSCVDGSFFSCPRQRRQRRRQRPTDHNEDGDDGDGSSSEDEGHKGGDFIDPVTGQRFVRLIFPFCSFSAWKADASFLRRCSWGVAQYVVVRVVTSVTTLILEDRDLYGDGSWDPRNPSLWLTLVINVSQLWALWCLIFFAATLWPALKPLKPLNKFLLVKVVVFGLWWQSVCLEIIASAGWLRPLDYTAITSEEDIEASSILQNVLITAEIVVITILHHYNFGLADFSRPELAYALLWNSRRARGRLGSDKASTTTTVSTIGTTTTTTATTTAAAIETTTESSTNSSMMTTPVRLPRPASGLSLLKALLLDSNTAASDDATAANSSSSSPIIFESSNQSVTEATYSDLFMIDVIQESAAVFTSAGTAGLGALSTAGSVAVATASSAVGAMRGGARNLAGVIKLGSPPHHTAVPASASEASATSNNAREPLI